MCALTFVLYALHGGVANASGETSFSHEAAKASYEQEGNLNVESLDAETANALVQGFDPIAQSRSSKRF